MPSQAAEWLDALHRAVAEATASAHAVAHVRRRARPRATTIGELGAMIRGLLWCGQGGHPLTLTLTLTLTLSITLTSPMPSHSLSPSPSRPTWASLQAHSWPSPSGGHPLQARPVVSLVVELALARPRRNSRQAPLQASAGAAGGPSVSVLAQRRGLACASGELSVVAWPQRRPRLLVACGDARAPAALEYEPRGCGVHARRDVGAAWPGDPGRLGRADWAAGPSAPLALPHPRLPGAHGRAWQSSPLFDRCLHSEAGDRRVARRRRRPVGTQISPSCMPCCRSAPSQAHPQPRRCRPSHRLVGSVISSTPTISR